MSASATLQEIKLNELCDSISKLNKSIESVTVINKFGRPVEKVNRKNGIRLLSKDKDEMFFMQCVLEISMGKEFDHEYGPINYHLSERDNLTMITVPIRDHVIVVKANKDNSPISLSKKIVKTIKSYT